MICPNCRCEIGNLAVCPYCGMRQRNAGTTPIRPQGTTQVRNRQAVPMQTKNSDMKSVYRSEQGNNRHMSNIDTWSLMCVILLAGIFVMELLQLILLALG